jgi:hypothetical protein
VLFDAGEIGDADTTGQERFSAYASFWCARLQSLCENYGQPLPPVTARLPTIVQNLSVTEMRPEGAVNADGFHTDSSAASLKNAA